MQIEIRKGKNTAKVSRTAFENFFKNNGWVECKNSAQPTSKKNEVVENETIENNEDSEDWGEVETEEVESDDFEKPLSEMNRSELIELAEKLNVDVNGLTKNAQLREAIKKAM